MASLTIADVSGTIQKYFEKSWMDQDQNEYRTPLANSNVLEVATIPKNSGQYGEFRIFDHLTVEPASASDDTPKTYSENAEPATALALSGTIYQVSFEMLADWMDIGNVAASTDPIDLIKKAKEEFMILLKRKCHRLTNSRFVKAITANVLNSTLTPTPLPAPFKTIFAQGVKSFGDIKATSYFTGDDFKRARMLLRNWNVPGVYGGMTDTRLYAAFVEESILAQLEEDEKFRDAVKRHEDLLQKSVVQGGYVDWEGMRFTLQDDGYRCNLPAQGGVLTTRKDTGKVAVAHVLGKGAAGYIDFGGSGSVSRSRLMPAFKVQDLSKTGTGPTIGWRCPYQACVLNNNRGVNIAGCSDYMETVADIA